MLCPNFFIVEYFNSLHVMHACICVKFQFLKPRAPPAQMGARLPAGETLGPKLVSVHRPPLKKKNFWYWT